MREQQQQRRNHFNTFQLYEPSTLEKVRDISVILTTMDQVRCISKTNLPETVSDFITVHLSLLLAAIVFNELILVPNVSTAWSPRYRPGGKPSRTPPQPASTEVGSTRLKSCGAKVIRAWLATQLTNYGGKYSVGRMLALDEYIRATSLRRVLLVILATPIPMALLVIAQESVPLQDPAEGWSANYGFWIRVFILEGTLAFTSAIHAGNTIDGATLLTRQLVTFCICVAALSVVADMGIAALWTFPIPFFTISLSMVVVLIMMAVFRAIVGAQAFSEIAKQREQLMEYNNFHSVNILMVTAYPAFEVLFEATLDTKWEQLTILLLPVLKLVLKNVYMRTFTTKEDMLPEEITFSVNFFDALYLATCMQHVKSIKTVVVIMAADMIETAFELRELDKRTRSVLSRIRAINGGTNGDLLGAIRSMCTRVEEASEERPRSTIRLRSCISSHKISQNSTLLLQRLDSRSFASSRTNSLHSFSIKPHASSTTILPDPKLKWCSSSKVQPVKTAISVGDDSVGILQESLEVLFTAECLVLAEYLETFIPILYANFTLVMVHLPSAAYHREMEGLTRENVSSSLDSVFIYGLLELVSFVALAAIMQRNCGIRSLYHLGFVLETQTALVQSKMLIWAMMTLTYRVIHFGADFSFQFAWIS